jgi:hypothetical protein
MSATTVTANNQLALLFLSLGYAGIMLQQPNLCAVSLDTGRKHAGTVFAFMNMMANMASAISSIVFGYLVAFTGSYDAVRAHDCPAGAGTWLWRRIDPTQQVVDETPRVIAAPAVVL